MSDINELIASNARVAFDTGVKTEQQRIIELLQEHTHLEAESEYLIDCDLCERYYGVGVALALIKGQNRNGSVAGLTQGEQK